MTPTPNDWHRYRSSALQPSIARLRANPAFSVRDRERLAALGFDNTTQALTGPEIDVLSDAELVERTSTVNVFGACKSQTQTASGSGAAGSWARCGNDKVTASMMRRH